MAQTKNLTSNIKSIQELPIIGRAPESEKEEKWLREVKTYEFYNIEEPGMSLRFPYGDSKRNHSFTFFHGGKYELPRFIARHVEQCSKPMYEWRPDGTGRMQKTLMGKEQRFQMRETFGV